MVTSRWTKKFKSRASGCWAQSWASKVGFIYLFELLLSFTCLLLLYQMHSYGIQQFETSLCVGLAESGVRDVVALLTL